MTRVLHLVIAEQGGDPQWLVTLQAMRQAGDQVLVIGLSMCEIRDTLELLTTDGAQRPGFMRLDATMTATPAIDVAFEECSCDELVQCLSSADQVLSWP